MITSGWKFKREVKEPQPTELQTKELLLLHIYQRIRDLLSPDTTVNNWFIDYRSSITYVAQHAEEMRRSKG